jgi:hypothetical protein
MTAIPSRRALLAALCVLALGLGTAGCGDNEQPAAPSAPPPGSIDEASDQDPADQQEFATSLMDACLQARQGIEIEPPTQPDRLDEYAEGALAFAQQVSARLGSLGTDGAEADRVGALASAYTSLLPLYQQALESEGAEQAELSSVVAGAEEDVARQANDLGAPACAPLGVPGQGEG